MRLIDADELITAFPANEGGVDVKICSVRGTINNMPTIDAEPVKHGHWNYKFTINGQSYRYCSECLEIIYDDMVSKNYCPHCGAKMD